MKNSQKLGLIAAITSGLILQATPPALASRRTINCNSHKGRYNYCQVDTRGGVKLERQTSDSSCRQGRTWGYDRGGIWVDRGCSGRFSVRSRGNNDYDYDNGGSNNTAAIVGGALVVGAIAAAIASGSNDGNSDNNITCDSRNGRYTRCSLDLDRRDRVYLIRQLSNSGCWEGDTWGYDRDGIWVDEGCRGKFEVQRRR